MVNRKHNSLLLFSTVNVVCQVVKQIHLFSCVPNMSSAAGMNKHFLMPFCDLLNSEYPFGKTHVTTGLFPILCSENKYMKRNS